MEIQLIVHDTQRSLVDQENARQSVNQLPTELFTHVASFFGQRDLWSAALVCHSWRATLVGCPHLWTRVCISQRGCTSPWSTRSAAILGILLARSRDLPLIIEFRCLCEDDYQGNSDNKAYSDVAALIAGEMHRVRSLSLVIPDVSGTALEKAIEQPAPIISCFRLRVVMEWEYLSQSLFAQFAPRLTILELSMVNLAPDGNYHALRSVQHFAHDAPWIGRGTTAAVCGRFPALRSLTLHGHYRSNGVGSASTVSTGPSVLRLQSTDSVMHVLDALPNATAICLSCNSPDDLQQPAIKAMISTLGPGHPTSIELCYRPMQLVVTGPFPEYVYICLRLDDAGVAVDLDAEDAGIVLGLLAKRSKLESVRRIVVDEELWPLFRPPLVTGMSSLRELTVYLSPSHTEGGSWRAAGLLAEYSARHGTARGAKLGLELLRLVAPLEARMSPLEEAVVADVVQTMLDPDALRTLVLGGISLVPPDGGLILHSLAPHLSIVHEIRSGSLPDEPWFWMFPEDEAICI